MSRGQHARVRVQDNVRTGAIIAANELREIGYDSVPPSAAPELVGAFGSRASSDLVLVEPGRVWYRAMRGFGVTCAAPTTARLALRRALYAGVRDPQPGDSLTLFVEGDPALGSDDSWVRAGVAGVGKGACEDGSAALDLSLAWADPAVAGAAVAAMAGGGPVRLFEVMELRYYASGGAYWLGMRSLNAGGSIEPLVGPLADSAAGHRGVYLELLDAKNNARHRGPRSVRAIAFTLSGVTDERVYGRAGPPPHRHGEHDRGSRSGTRSGHEATPSVTLMRSEAAGERGLAVAVAFALVVVGALVAAATLAGNARAAHRPQRRVRGPRRRTRPSRATPRRFADLGAGAQRLAAGDSVAAGARLARARTRSART